MDIPINAQANCNGLSCGRSFCVIIDPVKRKLTHVVIRESHVPHRERLVPVEMIADVSPHAINLSCEREELARLDEFIGSDFVKVDEPIFTYAPDEYLLWPDPFLIESHRVSVKREQVPPGELALHRGARVMCVDGKIGQVDEFQIDPKDDHITHIVLQEGHLWGRKTIAIPVDYIDHLEKTAVYLKLAKHDVNLLFAGQKKRVP